MNNKEKGFSKIFEDNRDRVYRICCSYVRNNENRNDLFQEIFINIWSNLSSFREASHVNTWIYRIAINTAINFCRLNNRNEKRCSEINQDLLSNAEKELELKRIHEKELEAMFQAINSLSVVEKSIITLILEGLDHRTIADICEMTEVNVRVRFHRIKKKLKQIMEENKNEL